MELELLNQNGSSESSVSLVEAVFKQEFNQDLVHQLVNTYIHNGHQRTKGQKNRSAVRGGGKSLEAKRYWKARAGTIRSPIWRGGGMTFASVYQDIKLRRLIKNVPFSLTLFGQKVEEGSLVLVDDLQINEPVKSSQIKKSLLT